MNTESYHICCLRQELQRRQRLNPAYSLRSFARFLRIDSGVLSGVLNGKRGLSATKTTQLCSRLGLSEIESTLFAESVRNCGKLFWRRNGPGQSAELQNRFVEIQESELNYKIYSEWEYFTIFCLTENVDFREDFNWIGERLEITAERAEEVVNGLLAANLIHHDAGRLKRTNKNITTTDGVRSRALRQGNRELLTIAEKKIDEIDLDLRSFSGVTLSLDRRNLQLARDLIRAFRETFSETMETGEKNEVYQLSIQLFPLTKIEK